MEAAAAAGLLVSYRRNKRKKLVSACACRRKHDGEERNSDGCLGISESCLLNRRKRSGERKLDCCLLACSARIGKR